MMPSGEIVLVDEEDLPRLCGFSWRVLLRTSSGKYIGCRFGGKDISLSRYLMSAPSGVFVDHKNGDTLDCRKENLRFCSHSENMRNCRKRRSSQYRFKGISFSKFFNRWRAKIDFNKKRYYLGVFRTETEAALAYDAAARKYHGEFARTNF